MPNLKTLSVTRLTNLWLENETRISALCRASQHDAEYLRLLEIANRRKRKVDRLNAPKVHALSMRSEKLLDAAWTRRGLLGK